MFLSNCTIFQVVVGFPNGEPSSVFRKEMTRLLGIYLRDYQILIETYASIHTGITRTRLNIP